MSYTGAFEPKVIRTYPSNFGTDIPQDAKIVVDFNTDLDRDYIEAYLQLHDENGYRVPFTYEYVQRTVTISPDDLVGDVKYTVTLVGDDLSGKGHGLRSALGEHMRGNYVFSFRVKAVEEAEAPRLLVPNDQSNLTHQPKFIWELASEIEYYQLQISQMRSFDKILYPARPDEQQIVYDGLGFDTLQVLEDGTYYWRVRGIRLDGEISPWSEPYIFSIDRVEKGFVSDEDAPLPIPPIDMMEILEVFPEEGFVNVSPNLKQILITVLGTYQTADVQNCITLSYTPIDGEEWDETDVTGTIEAYPQGDGTTVIAFIIDPLEVV